MTTESLIPSFIGAPVQRREDPALITGTATYVDDIAPAGTLHLGIVRSPFAHADVTGIDIDAALEVEGVRLILTPEDVADVSMPPTPDPDRSIPRRYPLVQGRVLMPGDPVAAVVAESAASARDAADLIFADFEGLDGIRLSGTVDHPRVVPAPMESRAIVAEWKDDGLVVHLSSQAPHLMQERLAADFGLPQASVRVITPFVGGGFGCKFDLAEEEYLAVIASLETGQPIKWIETRREHLLTIGHGRSQLHRWEAVAGPDGKITGLWVDSLIDLGCRHRYLSFMEITPRMQTGAYDIPVYGWRMRGVWTNRAPRGIYRGAGWPEATLTIERVVDLQPSTAP